MSDQPRRGVQSIKSVVVAATDIKAASTDGADDNPMRLPPGHPALAGQQDNVRAAMDFEQAVELEGGAPDAAQSNQAPEAHQEVERGKANYGSGN